jgi:hypothetical protein
MEKILQKKICECGVNLLFKKTQIQKDTFSCLFTWEWAKQISTEVEWVK